MTRALLTDAMKRELIRSGFYIAVDAGAITATLYRDKVATVLPGLPTLEPVGTLSYRNNSVDYDELSRLLRKAA